MSLHLLILIFKLITLGLAADFSPDLQHNVLRFPYGINFKFNGKLHHNMARVWIVTKFPLPAFNKVFLPPQKRMSDCGFDKHPRRQTTRGDIPFMLYEICKSTQPILKLLEKKENLYRQELQQKVEKEMLSALPYLGTVPAGRPKRFVNFIIPALAGVVTLAVEGVSTFLKNKRQKYMTMAMAELKEGHLEHKNILKRHQKDLMMYGEFSMNSTVDLVDALEDMYHNVTSVEKLIVNLTDNMSEWPKHYLNHALGGATYATHIAVYFTSYTEKILEFYRSLLYKVDQLIDAIKILSEGKLPIHLVPPDMLQSFVQEVADHLEANHPQYTLAMPHLSYYYDMKLVTFGVDKDKSLIVTFPILIKPISNKPLSIYEIETVYVPVDDENPKIDSYTRVHHSKPYIAANHQEYIQLKIEELNMCKHIGREYFCEELFMVKEARNPTCESILLYGEQLEKIPELCDFEFSKNKTVLPSVLDGGEQIILANLNTDRHLKCSKQLKTPLPKGSYILTNRSVLCHCSVLNGNSYIPQDLGSCLDNDKVPTFRYTKNSGFMQTFNYLMSYTDSGDPPFPSITNLTANAQNILPSIPQPLPLDINKTFLPTHINKLKAWVQNHQQILTHRLIKHTLICWICAEPGYL